MNEKELIKSLKEYEQTMISCKLRFKPRLQHYINIVNELLNGKRESD